MTAGGQEVSEMTTQDLSRRIWLGKAYKEAYEAREEPINDPLTPRSTYELSLMVRECM